jgi:hypothetical protein
MYNVNIFQLIEIVVFKPQITKKNKTQKTNKEEEKKSWLIDICLTSSGKYLQIKWFIVKTIGFFGVFFYKYLWSLEIF